MKRMSAFAASVVAMGLYTAPVGAQLTGTIQGLSQGQVVCVNSTDTGTGTVVGPLTAGSFDCSELSFTPGDNVTIVIAGPVEEGSGGTGCSTPPVPEQEPNDDFPQSQNVGTLQSGGCIAVAGSTDVGFGNPDAPAPNADFDYYLFSLVGVSRFRIAFDLLNAQTILFSVFNADTQAQLEVQSEPGIIEVDVPVQTSRIIFRMSTDVPDSYTLTFSDRSGTVPAPLGTLTTGPRLIEEHP